MSETAKELRTMLKTAGFNSRRVSVRHHQYSMGSSLYLTIRDPEVKKSEIKDIALKFERVDHCQFSGEILSGGNRFVDINYSQKARDILVNRVMPSVNMAVSELEGIAGSGGVDFYTGYTLFRSTTGPGDFQIFHGNSHLGYARNPEQIGQLIALNN